MLSTNCASKLDREREGLTNSRACASDGFPVFPVAHKVNVNVSIPRMTEVDDKRPVTKAEIVNAMARVVPDLVHGESSRTLDGRM